MVYGGPFRQSGPCLYKDKTLDHSNKKGDSIPSHIVKARSKNQDSGLRGRKVGGSWMEIDFFKVGCRLGARGLVRLVGPRVPRKKNVGGVMKEEL